ncbi:unnamed protein product [Prorocentrum cordatum]|uniref:Uncharacterized protein n=1 Tax=Prorocentrum cordatum TaxID=2364126 RepID=A0ABN9RYF5_9DINO|nr:unnamed protein product [Polarella glacialis]
MSSGGQAQACRRRHDALGVPQREPMGVEPVPREDEVPWPTRLVRIAGSVADDNSEERERWPITRTQRRRLQRKCQKSAAEQIALQQWRASAEAGQASPPLLTLLALHAHAASGYAWPTVCSFSL